MSERVQSVLSVLRLVFVVGFALVSFLVMVDPFGWQTETRGRINPQECREYRFTVVDDLAIPAQAQGIYIVDRQMDVVFFTREITNDTYVEITLKPRFDDFGMPVRTPFIIPRNASFFAEGYASGEFRPDSNPYFASITSHFSFRSKDSRLSRESTLHRLELGLFKKEEIHTPDSISSPALLKTSTTQALSQ